MTLRPPLRALSALVLACLAAAPLRAQPLAGTSAELELRTNRHSDFSTLADLDSDDEVAPRLRARHGRNIAYLDDEARLRWRHGGWSAALLARSTATLVANRDAIDAYRHAKREGRDGSDRHWDLQARLRGFNGFGLELARAFEPAPAWSGAVQAQALALTRLRDRRITGSADFQAATRAYTVDLRSDEVNDRLQTQCPRFLQAPGGGCFHVFGAPPAARGAGLLFGADLGWTHGDWSVRAGVRDLGWLRWKRLPHQVFEVDNDRQVVGPDGFLVIPLSLSATNVQGTVTRRAQARGSLAADWRATAAGRLAARADYIEGFGWLPALGWSQRWGALEGDATWQVHERRLVLGAQWQGLRVRLGADRLGGGSRSRLVSLGYSRAF